jgi:hypothetical protein
VKFQQTEQAFTNAADPRIWQWKNMPPGPAKQALAQRLKATDPSIMDKINTLEKLGAFK